MLSLANRCGPQAVNCMFREQLGESDIMLREVDNDLSSLTGLPTLTQPDNA